jgi:hypothetical protein
MEKTRGHNAGVGKLVLCPRIFWGLHLPIRGEQRLLAGASTDLSSETLLSAGTDVLAAHCTLHSHLLSALIRHRILGPVE